MNPLSAGLSDYFAMGGYAVFVWPSYGLALVVLVAFVVLAYRRMRAAEGISDGARDGAPNDKRVDRPS